MITVILAITRNDKLTCTGFLYTSGGEFDAIEAVGPLMAGLGERQSIQLHLLFPRAIVF
jgi:hypothetical protein